MYKGHLRPTIFQMIRFAIVGVIATVIHYSVFLLLRQFLGEVLAFTIGYIVSLVCNFLLTCNVTFQKKANAKRGGGFVLAHVINYTLQVVLLKIFLELGVPAEYAPFPVYCISVPVNFTIIRFIFR